MQGSFIKKKKKKGHQRMNKTYLSKKEVCT